MITSRDITDMLKHCLMHFSQIAAEPLDELWSVMSSDILLNTKRARSSRYWIVT